MVGKISNRLILLLFFVCSSVYAHKLKLSTALIEYNEKSTNIDFMFNVFMDDFVVSANKLISKEIDYVDPSKADKKRVKKYFDTYFKISINGIQLDLKYNEIEVHSDYNAFRFKFSCDNILIKKGDDIFIENNILFNQFEYQQTNVTVIKMSPFFDEKYYHATFKSATYKLNI